MKIGVAILFFVGLFAIPGGRENSSTNQAFASSLGLEIGQPALGLCSARSIRP
jgi:hypothetical protein